MRRWLLLVVVAATGCGALPPTTEIEGGPQSVPTDSKATRPIRVDAPPCLDECYLSMRRAGCFYPRCTRPIPAQRIDGQLRAGTMFRVRPGECRLMYSECRVRCFLHDPETIAACKYQGGCAGEDTWRVWREGLDACNLDPECDELEYVEANLSPLVRRFPCR